MTIPTWSTSRDAVPDGYVQVTVYEESTGDRVATVFDAQALAIIEAAPALLACAMEALRTLDAHGLGDTFEARGLETAILEATRHD
jgi:hypothetical protein